MMATLKLHHVRHVDSAASKITGTHAEIMDAPNRHAAEHEAKLERMRQEAKMQDDIKRGIARVTGEV